MPANTTHGLPYPLGTDRVMDGDNAIKALAEALDPASPYIDAGFTVAAGWTIQSQVLYVIGARVELVMEVTRTGSAITMGSDGNVGDVMVGTGMSTAYRPGSVAFVDIIRAGSATFFGHISSTGDMVLTHGPPTASMPTATAPRIRGSWILGLS